MDLPGYLICAFSNFSNPVQKGGPTEPTDGLLSCVGSLEAPAPSWKNSSSCQHGQSGGARINLINTPCLILVSSLSRLNSADFSRSYLSTPAEPREMTLLGAEVGHAASLRKVGLRLMA
jgi:hypothetical protein